MTQQVGSNRRRAFLAAPNPQRYFAAGAIEEARQRVARSIARREGPALVVGAAGTGKSLLLAVLAEQFASRVAVVTLAGAQLCTRRALLQMVLSELGLPYRGMDEGELRLSILEYLRGAGTAPANAGGSGTGPRHLLLLVDEADSLPVRLLEELRVLTNVADQGLPLVSLVLAGGPILEERFADPQLDRFSQRIAARTYLAPLGRAETLAYVTAQVAAAGSACESLFAPDGLEAIYAATGGVPRLVNQLGDQLAWMAEETGCVPLDAALVQQAWSDIQQLPAPWNTDEPASSGASVVEFGELDGPCDSADAQDVDADDDADDMPASISIDAARRCDGGDHDADFDDETESLLERRPEPAPPAIHPAPTAAAAGKPLARDPFAESFDQEEVLLDPYASLKAELMRTAPQVTNRLDRTFAADLDRCRVEPAAQRARDERPAVEARPEKAPAVQPPAAQPAVVELAPARASDAPCTAKLRLHDQPAELRAPAEPMGDVLLIDDEDDRPAAGVVAGRQFRRLFSCLESGSARSLRC